MKIINVVLGRFQLVHEGHLALIAKAMKNDSECYILVGSADKSREVCNPFTFEERHAMIIGNAINVSKFSESVYAKFNLKAVLPIQDYDTDVEWVNCITNTIQDIKNNNKDSQINLITCKKDDKTANYIDLIKDAKIFDNVIEVEPYLENGKIISAKDKRKEFFTNTPAFKQSSCFWFTMTNYLEIYLEMQKKYIEAGLITEDDVYYANYKEEVKQYPRIEHTADIAVFHDGKVLLIKRGKTPGKGLYALPGGFVNQNETLLECALRELKEETGLVIKNDNIVSANNINVFFNGFFDKPNRSRRGRVITAMYRVNLPSNYDITLTTGDDASSAEWITLGYALDMNKGDFFEDHYDILCKMKHQLIL